MDKDREYQSVVDLEMDSLSRKSPCELMQIEPHSKKVIIGGVKEELIYTVFDLKDVRHIGIVVKTKLLMGHRNYIAGLTVSLQAERMSNEQACALFD